MTSRPGMRVGGHIVVESLEALGADAVFGLPGIHALAIWEALRTSKIRTLGFRTELNAGFAACGWAHVTGRAAPLLLSTGPGALNSLTALMEAASSHLPVVAIASQIPGALVGRGRGYLHELRDQAASFAPIVKSVARATSAAQIPDAIATAWLRAMTPPMGPTYVEIPVDMLSAAATTPVVAELGGIQPSSSAPSSVELEQAGQALASATRPVIWAGGGVLRSAAWDELAELATRLDSPVVTTYMGKGAFPADHPLAAGSACDDAAFRELLGSADVVLAVGTELGAETTGQYRLRLSGRLLQIDADPARIGATYPAFGLVGDAKATLGELIRSVAPRASGPGASRAAEVRQRIRRGLDAQGHSLERGLLTAIRQSLPPEGVTVWDMTILGYWAAAHYPVLEPRTFLYPLGSGTLGFAWPAALGAAAALPGTPVLAVVGDGGFSYGMSELVSARQHRLGAKLLLVDDGGYGILREYQRDRFRQEHGVDLIQPDFEALVAATGMPTRTTTGESIEADLGWAFEVEGPAAVVLKQRLASAAPTD
ncbi:MAG TPA: thiamine pyrophosphate-binding protein [Candidatus Dormibacteraeota bacterium]|nr:thiamine pyrophosphate-binding protein [Candidatus Dormibacteraeota bacterium]